jgi:hypothetical protein
MMEPYRHMPLGRSLLVHIKSRNDPGVGGCGVPHHTIGSQPVLPSLPRTRPAPVIWLSAFRFRLFGSIRRAATVGWGAVVCGMLALAAGGVGRGEPTKPAGGEADVLARREAELTRQYVDLERSFLRLADVLATTDPRRAAVLRDAFDQARSSEVGDRLGRIVTLLEAGQLLKAGAGQEGAIEQFRELLSLLEEGGGDRGLADTKQQVREFLTRVTKLIARQRDIEGSTEAGGDADDLGDRQRKAAAEAAELAGDLGRFARRVDESPADDAQPEGDKPAGEKAGDSKPGDSDSKPKPGAGDSKPGGDEGGEPAADGEEDGPITGDDDASRARRTQRRVQEAEKRMQAAREKLKDATRREARSEQEKAVEELETARAELEEILRQLREEEVERLLVQLETRIRQMLRIERGILAAAEKLAADMAMSQPEKRIEGVRIGREQAEVTAEAARALTLVRDDGSAVAVPEALDQVHDDCVQAAAKFTRGDVGQATLGLVGDIVTGLEELLAALEKSRRTEEEDRQQAGGAGGRPAEPGEQPLVDKLAELKMLRSLQLRVNNRTQRFSQLLDEGTERATEPELIEALGRLAERQRSIERAARDIVTGRTE